MTNKEALGQLNVLHGYFGEGSGLDNAINHCIAMLEREVTRDVVLQECVAKYTVTETDNVKG